MRIRSKFKAGFLVIVMLLAGGGGGGGGGLKVDIAIHALHLSP